MAAVQRQKSHLGLLASLCLFAGLTAIAGGVELVLRPDGSPAGLPLSLLQYSPFPDFLIPGLLLLCFVGVTNTIAGALVAIGRPAANRLAFVSGSALTIWIVVEVALLRRVHWLHIVYLLLGLAIQTEACLRERRRGTLDSALRSLGRVLVHAVAGWAACGATMGLLLATTTAGVALFVHALLAPVIFASVSISYFRGPAAWPPLRAAAAFVVLTGLLDLVVVACFVEDSLDMFRSFSGSWLPLGLIFGSTWATGTRFARGGQRV